MDQSQISGSDARCHIFDPFYAALNAAAGAQ